MKFKFTRKKIIIGSIIVLLILAVLVVPKLLNPNAGVAGGADGLDYTVLAKSQLIDSVSVSGTIESAKTENVYTTLIYPVQSISVSVGDSVKAGALLAKLDTASLSKDVEQARYSAAAAETSARLQLENAQSAYDSSKLSYDLGEISQMELKNALNNLKLAQSNYDNKSAQVSLSKLQSQLSDAQIKSPMDGTITMVNATVGTPATGVLFVVEDTANLIVKTGIKEFDVGSVKAGQAVTIKTDGTGDKSIRGIVLSISPAALKSATGQTVSSSNVEFEAKISLLDKDPNLKIGMNARLSITIAQKDNIYTVPYDAVSLNPDGTSSIYVAEKRGNGYVIKAVPVEIGMQTDFYIEISGAALEDGLMVISTPLDLKAGDPVNLKTPTPVK
jgi:RND family efflux transporter MFP subunit